jgi:hypothetical protein
MDSTKLQALIDLLRAAGVTKYATPELTLELGPAPVVQAPIDLTREGFGPRPQRDPHLQSVLDRLPGMYQDPALFDIR